MKKKISITLSEDILDAVDRRSAHMISRSGFIETAVRAYIAQMIRNEQNAKDLAIINRHADRLNIEAADVLTFQVIP